MKAKTLKDAVAEAIKYTGKQNDNVPILTHISVVSDITDGTRVSATDFESRIEIHIQETLGDWSAGIPAKSLLDFLASAGSDEIKVEFSKKSDKLKMVAGNASADFKIIDNREFPTAPTPVDGWLANFLFEKTDAAEWPARVGFCVSSDKARPILQGYHIRLINGFGIVVEAADGFRMSQMKARVDIPKGVKSILDGSWTMGKRAFENALKLGVDQFSANSSYALLQGKNIKVWIWLIEGNYPSLDQIIQLAEQDKCAVVTVNAKSMQSAIRRSQLFSENTCFESQQDKLKVYSNQSEIGSHEEFVDIKPDAAGRSLAFCLSSQFALEASSAGVGEYEIFNHDSKKPVMIRERGNAEWMHMVMPRLLENK